MAEQVPRSTHKFGGASVKDAAAIRRVGQLLANHLRPEEQAVVVVSAMGKTTNALEEVWRSCLLYTSPSPRDGLLSRMPSSA